MRTTTTFAFLAASLTLEICFVSTFDSTAQAANVTFDWATVGDPGNANDIHGDGYGAVANTYRISKTEVTNAQYTEFLNAVDPAAANTLGLFNSSMAVNFGGIENTGTTDGVRYVAQAGRENNPVTFVSWYDSVRFINWLHNGQGPFGTPSGDTEAGAYTLLGGTASPSRRFKREFCFSNSLSRLAWSVRRPPPFSWRRGLSASGNMSGRLRQWTWQPKLPSDPEKWKSPLRGACQ